MPFPSITPILTVVDNGNQIVVTDATVYTSPARNTLGIFILLVNPASSGDNIYQATAFDPELATVFTFPGLSVDGDHIAYYWPVNNKTGAETPVLNDFVWNATANLLERWNGSAWATATILDLYAYAPNQASKKHNQRNQNFILAIDRLNRYYASNSPRVSIEQLTLLIPESRITLDGANANFALTLYSEYQRIIEEYSPTVNFINALSQ